jgi:hypothetical protein
LVLDKLLEKPVKSLVFPVKSRRLFQKLKFWNSLYRVKPFWRKQMKDSILNLFKGNELEKRIMINSLMRDWEKDVENNRKGFKGEKSDCYFAADGFFPGYYKQKKKLVFVGREARWVDSCGYSDYIANFINWFKINNDHNRKSFTRHILYIAYGVKNNGTIDFEDVKRKTANGIAKDMAEENDYGYAMINVSKYSNEEDSGDKADINLISRFLEHSPLEKRNYFQEELAILEPDIIITGNLWDGKIDKNYLDLCFGKRKQIKESDGIADLYEVTISGRKVKLIDIYAFSSRYSDKEYFYDPVMKLIFNIK